MKPYANAFVMVAILLWGMYWGGVLSDRAHDDAWAHSGFTVKGPVIYRTFMPNEIVAIGVADCKHHGTIADAELFFDVRGDGTIVDLAWLCGDGYKASVLENIVLPANVNDWKRK